MARAKRTDRAEARRRYRAAQDVAPFADDATDGNASAEPVAAAARPSGRERVRAASTPPTPPTPPSRPSMRAAFSQAFHPVNIRGDLAALPGLLRHRSFLIPLALIVAAAVIYALTKGRETEVFGVTLYAYFLAAPPIAPVFVAGFLAPRASWLLGVVLGAISTLALVLVSTVLGEIQKVISETTGAGSALVIAIATSLLIAAVGGALFASVAAWYKRFLFLANPARAQRGASRPGNQQRKRNSDSRPALARRR